MHKVTTVIANFNYGNKLIACLNSAFNCDTTGFVHKIVLVDDGSTDRSVEFVKQAFGHKFKTIYTKDDLTIHSSDNFDFIISPNKGASAARNTAIKHSWNNTDFFHILDSDDKMVNNKIVKMLEKVEHPEVGVVYGDYIIKRPLYSKIEFKYPYDQNHLKYECIVHSGSLIRKHYLNLIKFSNGDIYDVNLHGPASTTFIGCTEDYDLWLRLSNVCIMVHIPEVLSIVSEHGNNQSLKMNNEIYRKNMEYIQRR